MTLYQVVTLFIQSIKLSSLWAMSKQLPNIEYRLLIKFFQQSFDPQRLIQSAWQQLFNPTDGWFILDEIVIEKSKEGKLRLVKRRWKSAGGYITPAISVVLLLWTNGTLRIPIRFQLWNPDSGSHIDAALRLLSWARNRLRWNPRCVLFDAGFASQRLLKRIDDYGWPFVCRIPKNRKLGEKKLFQYKKQGYWHEIDYLSNGLKVLAVRRASKFYICNRVTWSAQGVIEWYGKRHTIEETFKILKGVCHWKGCQFNDSLKYERFLAVGTVTFMVLELSRIHHPVPITIYRLKQNVIFDDFNLPIPHLDGILDVA